MALGNTFKKQKYPKELREKRILMGLNSYVTLAYCLLESAELLRRHIIVGRGQEFEFEFLSAPFNSDLGAVGGNNKLDTI